MLTYIPVSILYQGKRFPLRDFGFAPGCYKQKREYTASRRSFLVSATPVRNQGVEIYSGEKKEYLPGKYHRQTSPNEFIVAAALLVLVVGAATSDIDSDGVEDADGGGARRGIVRMAVTGRRNLILIVVLMDVDVGIGACCG